MSTEKQEPIPSEINLHQKSRMLTIAFSDGARFELPCEYLRVFSKAAEVRVLQQPVTGKEEVNITRIEPLGNYAVRLYFDDGHDTGVYSWSTLYELGVNREQNWRDYLKRLDEIGYQRKNPLETMAGRQRRVKLLYFVYLVNAFGRESEEVDLPETVSDVASLLQWLRGRGGEWARFLTDENVQVTVNKQFSEPFTKLEDKDEIALVPASPQPPDV